MEIGFNHGIGVASQELDYQGKHQSMNMSKGIGLIPLGDRERAKPEYGVDAVEERDSIDRYTKYINVPN